MRIKTAAQEESLLSPLLATPECRRSCIAPAKCGQPASSDRFSLPCFPQRPRYAIPTQTQRNITSSTTDILASEPLVADLKACVYRHSIDKFVGCIEKRYETFLDYIERLKLYMATALGQDNNTWQTLLDARDIITAIIKSVLPTDFEYEQLVSVLDTLNRKVRVVWNSDAVTEWPDNVKRKYAD